MLSAHGTEGRLLFKALAAVLAYTSVTTRHQNCILLFKQADLAQLGVFIFFTFRLSFFHFNVLLHAVNSFAFKGHTVNYGNLLSNPNSVDILIRVLGKCSVVDVAVLLA
jgi:hypothetical protein